jgi:hypothetical protein
MYIHNNTIINILNLKDEELLFYLIKLPKFVNGKTSKYGDIYIASIYTSIFTLAIKSTLLNFS